MNKYNVHLYAIVRIKAVDIEAESQTEAINKASEHIHKVGGDDLRYLLGYLPPNPLRGIESVEYAEEIDGFLVDEVGDKDFAKSQWYTGDGKTIKPLSAKES